MAKAEKLDLYKEHRDVTTMHFGRKVMLPTVRGEIPEADDADVTDASVIIPA